jgi:hypothetical protein
MRSWRELTFDIECHKFIEASSYRSRGTGSHIEQQLRAISLLSDAKRYSTVCGETRRRKPNVRTQATVIDQATDWMTKPR